MKLIAVRARVRPFSHQPGIQCLIPGTTHLVTCFPALLRVGEKEIPLEGGEGFTVVQDGERRCVTVFSHNYCVHILPSLEVVAAKNPGTPLAAFPRYCFGAHKKQEWERMHRNCDFTAILPLWLRLGHLLTLPACSHDGRGVFGLLEECVACELPENIFPLLKRLFLAGFGQMMVPRITDTEYQGILPREAPLSVTPAPYLLTQGAEWMRSLFIREEGEKLHLLPKLPPELHAGRILGENCTWGTFDCLWSQKRLRQFVLHATRSGELQLSGRYRMRVGKKQKGTEAGTRLAIEQGESYYFDRFET